MNTVKHSFFILDASSRRTRDGTPRHSTFEQSIPTRGYREDGGEGRYGDPTRKKGTRLPIANIIPTSIAPNVMSIYYPLIIQGSISSTEFNDHGSTVTVPNLGTKSFSLQEGE